VTAVEYQGIVVQTDLRADDGTELVAVAADHLFDREPLEPGRGWRDLGRRRHAPTRMIADPHRKETHR